MLVVTTEHIEGYKVVEVKGSVFGLIVRSRGLGGDIMAGLKGLVGGEIKQYTAMLEDSRKEAIDRMIMNANEMGANAIIMMRYDSGEMGKNMSEIVAYGTAVVVEKLK
ncbi:YbjQ family protein [Viridibacillus sp. NPDC093762]|uniref:YbjQ family protein n=2 Tax=Bacillales TaxID=1385 RepID=UPI003D04C5C4